MRLEKGNNIDIVSNFEDEDIAADVSNNEPQDSCVNDSKTKKKKNKRRK